MLPSVLDPPVRLPASLSALAHLALIPASTASVAHVVEACTIVRAALRADDAYIIRAGEPHFVRIGSDADPTAYEIKQKGYYLNWRELASNPELIGVGARIENRLVMESIPLVADARPTHIASLLPAYEGTSEALVVRGPWPDGLTAEDISFLTIVRPLLASLVGNLLDAERQQRQQRQLELFADVAVAFNEARQTDNVLTAIATALAKASGFDYVSIVLFDQGDERAIERAHNLNRYSDSAASSAYWELEGAEAAWLFDARHMARTGKPLLWSDVFADGARSPHGHYPADGILRRYCTALVRFFEIAHILSTAVVPIRFQDEVLGSIFLSSTTRRGFDAQETALLTALAAQAAASIGGLRLHQQLREANDRLAYLATHDVLTGLPNRAFFHERLTRALEQSSESPRGASVALLSVDLDFFKLVNDTLGHPAGDELLIAVAGRLTASVRSVDTIARFGGDEFAMLVHGDATSATAQAVADRLITALRAPFLIAGREIKIGASVGISLGVRGETAPDELLREADVALYQAKAAGRGQTSFFDEQADAYIHDQTAWVAPIGWQAGY